MRRFSWLHFTTTACLAAALAAGLAADAEAQGRRKKAEAEEQVEGPQFSKEFRKVAADLQKFANDKQWAELLAGLPELEALPDLNADEKKVIATWRLQATQGVDDQEGFARAIEVFLREGYAGPEQVGPMHRQLAAHFNNLKDTEKTVYHWRQFVDATPDVEPDELVTLARLYRQGSQFAECSEWFGKAMNLARSRGGQPQEEWFQLRDHCLGEAGDAATRLANLEELVSLYPDRKYYSNIAALYQAQTDDDRIVMQNVYRLAVTDPKGGLATVGGYLGYADLALAGGSPGEAARALERGMADGVVPPVGTNEQLLKDARAAVASDQRSLPSEAAAAQKNPRGEVAVKVGLGFYSTGNFERAAELAKLGISKGGVTRLDDANLLLGASLMELGRRQEAKAAFEAAAAAAGSGPMARIARMWIARAERDASAPAGG